ncbi:hypothetical protein ACROYT_G018721 [Oculina patagonica]
MVFQELTNTDYAIKENSIVYDLDAATVCFFAKDTDDNKPYVADFNVYECLYSYNVAVETWGNALMLCTYPTLTVEFDYGAKRYADVGLNYGKWNHFCFTWSNTNGDYKFYKDGVVVGSGTGLNAGLNIISGGTTTIGQYFDVYAGRFNPYKSFVGEVTEVNVWGEVLSESDIAAQYATCHVTQGSVNWWSQFKDDVHGGIQIVEP